MSENEFAVVQSLPDDYDWEKHSIDSPRERLAKAIPPKGFTEHREGARAYRPDANLITAVNAAMHLRAPLLLTGDPGTGKTQFAYFLGCYFAIEVFAYTVRSTSTARDLRYDFDAVAYLREAYLAQSAETDNAKERSGSDDPDQDPRMKHIARGPLWLAFEYKAPCVVLIDEIDKAPRDFPNDLLQELDKHEFPHPFNPNPKFNVRADRDQLPIVVVTSNNERRLPDAFLRRCIVHNIELSRSLIERAVAAHGTAFEALDETVRAAAIGRFRALRRIDRLSRKPGIAELLAWLVTLARAEPDLTAETLESEEYAELPHLHCLIKDHDDHKALKELRRR
jgi:MoxR-like ATPase